jgi:peroxiredoxin Q/BCP
MMGRGIEEVPMRRSVVLALGLVALLGASVLHAQEKPAALKPGDAAPDFALKDHTGQTVKLADLKGKHVVLWFFPKADTPG